MAKGDRDDALEAATAKQREKEAELEREEEEERKKAEKDRIAGARAKRGGGLIPQQKKTLLGG